MNNYIEIKYFIKQAISLGLLNSLDIQFAQMLIAADLSKKNNNHDKIKAIVLMIASAYLSSKIRLGHTCFPISLLSKDTFLQNFISTSTYKVIQNIKKLTIDDWKDLLCSSAAVGNGLNVSPLVMENDCLYLYRMWKDECVIAKFFIYSNNNINLNQSKKIVNILNKLFPPNIIEIDWHKIAVAISLIHPRVFISGGPGTGKTSIISKIIIALLSYNKNLNIQTTATTGKSAVILTHSCKKIIKNLENINNLQQYQSIPQAITVHSLLRKQLYYNKNRYNFSKNELNLDCLIIDESSMISLSILSNLISILPIQIKIIFLGDHHQLYSVDSGSVFQEICRFSNHNYSIIQQKILQELTGYTLTAVNNLKIQNSYYDNIIDKICVLKQNYRFHNNSGIGQLSNAIKLGNHNRSISILTSKIYSDLKYFQITNQTHYVSMITNCAKKYYKYLKVLKYEHKSIIKILRIFNEYQILCALKQGPFGATQLNYYIEQVLNQSGLIRLNQSKNYIGRPIIILCNDSTLGLYNGDIGILLPNTQESLSAYFEMPENKIKIIHINQLPSYETCFAMTIHKAQGSSFQKITIILPNQKLPILNRELIYTAITRAKQKLSLYATEDVLSYSIQNRTIRYSGLYNKMEKYLKNSCNLQHI